MTLNLYLASSSPRRIALLKKFHIPYIQIPNLLKNEVFDTQGSPEEKIKQLALKKATASKANYKGLILTMDTAVILKDKILGKPENIEKAKDMLNKLSGTTHQVITGICLLNTVTDQIVLDHEITTITFHSLSDHMISNYCTTHQVTDKAGGYAIQEKKDEFVKQIEGDYYNVVGCPVKLLMSHLNKILKAK